MQRIHTEDRVTKELQSFKDIWHGGYYEGNPLDPMGSSGYGVFGYMSVLHAVYLACVKPYINENSTVLEIGPGRGAWTKTFLRAKEVWCLDALPAGHNMFWEYIGQAPHVKYIQVNDFSCKDLPENRFNYFFSFGALCHVSFSGITEYMKNVYPKLVKGANCFIMVADYDKFNSACKNVKRYHAFRILENTKVGKYFMKPLWKSLESWNLQPLRHLDEDDVPRPARWYNSGVERTCAMLEGIGYRIVDPDMGVLHRDPVIHFVKP